MGQRTQIIIRLKDFHTGIEAIGMYHNQWGNGFALFEDTQAVIYSLKNKIIGNTRVKDSVYMDGELDLNTKGINYYIPKQLPSGAYLEYFADIGSEKVRKDFNYCGTTFNSKESFGKVMNSNIDATYFHRQMGDNNDGGSVIDVVVNKNCTCETESNVYFFKHVYRERFLNEDGILEMPTYEIIQCSMSDYISEHGYYSNTMSNEKIENITRSYETIIKDRHGFNIK